MTVIDPVAEMFVERVKDVEFVNVPVPDMLGESDDDAENVAEGVRDVLVDELREIEGVTVQLNVREPETELVQLSDTEPDQLGEPDAEGLDEAEDDGVFVGLSDVVADADLVKLSDTDPDLLGEPDAEGLDEAEADEDKVPLFVDVSVTLGVVDADRDAVVLSVTLMESVTMGGRVIEVIDTELDADELPVRVADALDDTERVPL